MQVFWKTAWNMRCRSARWGDCLEDGTCEESWRVFFSIGTRLPFGKSEDEASIRAYEAKLRKHDSILKTLVAVLAQSVSWVTMCTSTAGASRRKRWMAVMYKYFLQPSTAERPKITWVTCFSRTNSAVAEDTSLPVSFTTFAPRLSEN